MWMRFAVNADVAFIRGVDQAYYRAHTTNMTTARVPIVDLASARPPTMLSLTRTSTKSPTHSGSVGRSTASWRRRHCGQPVAPTIDNRLTQAGSLTWLTSRAARTPMADRLAEYWGLLWRRRAGPQVCVTARPFNAVGGASSAAQRNLVGALEATRRVSSFMRRRPRGLIIASSDHREQSNRAKIALRETPSSYGGRSAGFRKRRP